MWTWLFPYFLAARCLLSDGTISEIKVFGPFKSMEEASVATSLVAYGLLCDAGPPFRAIRWSNAIRLSLPQGEVNGRTN